MEACTNAAGGSAWTYRAYIPGEGWVSGEIALLSDGRILTGLDIRCDDPVLFGALTQAAMLALHERGEITITSMGEPRLERNEIRVFAEGITLDEIIEREDHQ